MTAITNLERLLSGDESVKPTTRIEQIIKGIDVKPLTHFEQIVCGYDIPPQNRLEQIIKGLDVGGYRSREEYFWGEWASGHGEIEYVGSVPFSVVAKGGNVSEWQIWGNAPYQEHTPSPDNPCEVKGVGDRTRNLLDTKIQWKKRFNGSEVTNTDTGFILIKKTESAQERVFVSFKNTKTGQYTVSLMLKNDKDRIYDTYGISVSDEEQTTPPPTPTGKTAIVNAGQYINIIISTQSAKAGTLEVSNIMLNEGSEPLSYEPYGYKTTMVDEGKNLLKYPYMLSGTQTKNGITAIFNPDQSVTLKGTATSTTWFNLNSDFLFGDRSITVGQTNYRYIASQRIGYDANNGFTFIQINKNEELIETIYPQIEKGTTTTPYVPYREPIETTIYSNEPYFTGDYVRKDSAGGVEHREWKKLVLTGNENWSTRVRKTELGGYYFIIPLDDVHTEVIKQPEYCTHFPNRNPYDYSTSCFMTIGQGQNVLRIGVENMNNVSNFKAWLKSEYDAGHPVTIYYQLATPTDKEKDLPEILLVNGYNGFDVDTEIKPEKMTLTYRVGKETAEADARLTAEFLNMMEEM